MFNNVLGRYINVDSQIHKMDPNLKMSCVLLFVVINFMAITLPLAIFMLLFTVIFLMLSNINIFNYLKGLKQVRVLIIFIILINLLMSGSLTNTLIIIIRLVTLLMYTMALTFTTKPNDINSGLIFVLTPLKIFKVPVNKIASLISISIKFIPVIFDQASTIFKAQLCRGGRYDGIKNKVIVTKNTILPLIILTLKRADELGVALEMKLYNYNNINFKKVSRRRVFDYYILTIHVLVVFLLIIERVIL